MSLPSSTLSMPYAVPVILGMIVAMLVTITSTWGGALAQSSNAFDAEQTPVPTVASDSAFPRLDIGPIREVAPRIRKALDDGDDGSEYLHLIEDPLGVISDAQANVLADDAHRLTTHGIPAMVIIRQSPRTREESMLDAAALRRRHRLETAPGADDGLLFLVTQPIGAGGSRGSRQSMFLTISVGAHTLPQGGLNEASLQNVQDRFVRPRLRFGLVADALRVGMRKIIYLETYYPDPPPPLTTPQSTTRSMLGIVAPILSIVSLGSVLATWRFPSLRSRRRRYLATVALGGVAVPILAIASVYGESRPGIVAVVAGLLALATHVRFLCRRAEHSPRAMRLVRASPRHTPLPSPSRAGRRRHIGPGVKRVVSPATPTP